MADRSAYLKEYYEKNKDKARAKNKAWYEAHKEESLEYDRKYRKANKEQCSLRRRIRKLRTEYDLSLDDYAAMLVKQDGKCAICERKMSKPHIDHNHSTGKVRGLLCGPCNHAIGLFKESIQSLNKAIEYLEKDR